MKKNKFDFNRKSMTVFQKFVGFLNEVTDEVKEIEKLSDTDETESGEVSLKYAIDDEKYYEVDAEGYVYGDDGSKLTDGEYPLQDGSVLVVTDGKFSGTILKEEAENVEKVEAPIAQEGEEEEKAEDEEADKSKEDEEIAQEDETENAEEPNEEEKEEEETVAKEEEVEQEGELVPFQVNGVEFMLPIEVVDYINSLTTTSEVFRKEIAQIKQRIPSTKPTTTAPIAQKKEVKVNLYDRVNMFRTK